MADNDHIKIPFPRPTQNTYRGRDVADPTKPTTIRLNSGDRKMIDEAAALVGVSLGEFMRWAAYYASVEVKRVMHLKTFEQPTKRRKLDLTGYE